ncbi:hypothetical protein [Streptomyces sp. CBMA156]|uniref:hypothetical protein n=1 Tax=Streptomyces sp. CBMA156 TaxID=1930280 RepID=UPI00294FFF2C|nr:hypothetical protein [Streptomyces sp. CBMA156]
MPSPTNATPATTPAARRARAVHQQSTSRSPSTSSPTSVAGSSSEAIASGASPTASATRR